MKVYYTNCRSFRNNKDLLRDKACVENFDIIAVTESWIATNSKNFLSEFKIEGYELSHEDIRKEGEDEWPFMLKKHSDSPLTIQLEWTLLRVNLG